MGKGRAPCCDKEKVKRGPWSPEEDLRLITYIHKHGHLNWRALPKQAGLLRCGKSCRLRWINYLNPDIKRGNFTKDEEEKIIRLHDTLGNKWSKIASQLPGRTDNEIKNVWNTHLKKRFASRNVYESDKSSKAASSSSSSCITLVSASDKALGIKTDSSSPSDEPEGLSSASTLSNITNSGHADVSNTEDQVGSLMLNFVGGCFDANYNNTLEEVNKPDNIPKTSFDIPFEYDLEFWNMLDSLGPDWIQPNDGTQSSNDSGEVENNWLLYLEQELGLESKDAGQAEPLVPEMVTRAGEEMGTGHYQNTVQPYESNSNK